MNSYIKKETRYSITINGMTISGLTRNELELLRSDIVSMFMDEDYDNDGNYKGEK